MNESLSSPLHGLKLLPYGLGILLGVEMGRLWPDLPLLYGRDGVVDSVLHEAWHSGTGWRVSTLIEQGSANLIYLPATIYLLLCALLLIPQTVRLASLFLLLLHSAFFLSDYRWTYGVDYLAQTGLFLCFIFYPGHRVVCSGWQHWGPVVFHMQMVLIYFFAGLSKALGSDWWNGEGLWKAIQHPFPGHYFQIPLPWGHFPILWMSMGIGILLLELLYPLMWIHYRFRRVILPCIILMHVGIALFLGLWHFAALMIWYNLCAWYRPCLYTTKFFLYPLDDTLPGTTSSARKDDSSIQGKEGNK